ncbi:MAG: helix-turn-helix domain-containing protein [Ruminococcaceae bacterium]|nr:helix-turn-helix domain-containing protein [Oscillospiraceae bacterium]
MSFNKKVNALLKEKGITKAQLAKAADIPYTTLDSMLKRDTDTEKLKTIYSIAKKLGVSVEYLVFDNVGEAFRNENPVYISENETELINNFRLLDKRGAATVNAVVKQQIDYTQEREKSVMKRSFVSLKENRIPVYSSPAAAGESLPFGDDDFSYYDRGDDVPHNADFGVRISGDSMEPAIKNNCVVWVQRLETVDIGSTGIFVLNGESLCKKLDFRNGKCLLTSINPKYLPIEVLESDDLRVVGKVLGSSIIAG